MLRYEYKYLVPVTMQDELRQRLAPFVDEDRFANIRADHQYTVRSIYYDNHAHRNYHEKIDGVERRKKIRIRGYNVPTIESQVFLEVKRKYGVFIAKDRAPVLWSELPALLSSRDVERHVIIKPGFAQGYADARHFFYHVISAGLRPTILITYEREAFFANFDRRIRMTFDKNIRFLPTRSTEILFNDKPLRPLFKQHFVFELKFHDSLPEWLRDVIRDLGLQRSAVSKYVLSLERAFSARPERIRMNS